MYLLVPSQVKIRKEGDCKYNSILVSGLDCHIYKMNALPFLIVHIVYFMLCLLLQCSRSASC
jgi:hypothetical protein